MYKSDDVLSNVIRKTFNKELKWKLLTKNRQLKIYISKKQLGKDKYLSFYLNLFFIGNEIDIHDIMLRIELTTTKNTVPLKKIISDFYPKVIDLYYLVNHKK